MVLVHIAVVLQLGAVELEKKTTIFPFRSRNYYLGGCNYDSLDLFDAPAKKKKISAKSLLRKKAEMPQISMSAYEKVQAENIKEKVSLNFSKYDNKGFKSKFETNVHINKNFTS